MVVVVILVPSDLDVRMKAVLLGALFLIVSEQQSEIYKPTISDYKRSHRLAKCIQGLSLIHI